MRGEKEEENKKKKVEKKNKKEKGSRTRDGIDNTTSTLRSSHPSPNHIVMIPYYSSPRS